MNRNISALTRIAAKKKRRIIGLMSGTSLDGLDVAVCLVEETGFETKITTEHFETIQYEPAFRENLREICFTENVSLEQLSLLNKKIAEIHAGIINNLLKEQGINKDDIDLIASHGQTIYHSPAKAENKNSAATLQAGDGDHISVNTGIITISDFRQKNIAGGGEGAPLAAYGDVLIFREKENNVLLLNIGGIANFTFLPANGRIISSDLGPGNTMMNAWMKTNFPGKEHDDNGALASAGIIHEDLLNCLRAHSFFDKPLPKTTGPELFNISFLNKALQTTGNEKLPVKDVMATLNKFTAGTIIDAVNKTTGPDPYKIFVSGGGIHNRVLMQHLKEGLKNAAFHDIAEKNIPPDGKEAVLFALLANECVAGDPQIFSGLPGALPAVTMGKISFPY